MKKLIAILLLFGIFGCAVEEVEKVAYVSGNTEGIYEGEWKDGQPNGQGTYTSTSGDTYVGEWKDGKKNGQGTMTWANGNTYVGEWKDNEKHGQGTMTYANGKKEVGEFKDGEYLTAKSDIDTSCASMLSDIDENEIRASVKYSDKVIKISGRVDRIRENWEGDSVIHLSSENNRSISSCALYDVPLDTAISLNKGQDVIFVCDSFSEIIGSALLDNCKKNISEDDST